MRPAICGWAGRARRAGQRRADLGCSGSLMQNVLRAARVRSRRAEKERARAGACDRPRRRDHGELSVGSARKLRDNTNISRIAAGNGKQGKRAFVPRPNRSPRGQGGEEPGCLAPLLRAASAVGRLPLLCLPLRGLKRRRHPPVPSGEASPRGCAVLAKGRTHFGSLRTLKQCLY